MKKPFKNWTFWISAFIFAVAVIVVYKTVDNLETIWGFFMRLAGILSPFVIGFVIAFLLYAPCNRLEQLLHKCKFRWVDRYARLWSVLLVFLALFALIILLISLAIPAVVQGVTGLINSLPSYFQNIKDWVVEYSKPGSILENFDIAGKIQELYNYLLAHLTVENLVGYLSGLASVTTSLANIFLAFIAAVYMLLGRESLLSTVKMLSMVFIKEKWVNRIASYCKKASDIFYSYLYSKLVDAVLIGLLVLPGLLIARMPYAGAFAILVGVMNLIPYFGSIVSGIICVIILLIDGHLGSAVFLGIYILVMQQIDGNVLQPRLFSQSVGIKPFYVLLAITIGGGFGGFIGMFIGVPIMAVIQILLLDYIEHRKRKTVHEVEPPSPEKDS